MFAVNTSTWVNAGVSVLVAVLAATLIDRVFRSQIAREAAGKAGISREGASSVENCGCLGDMTTNPAEYTALVLALEHALKLGAEHRIVLNSDSELMVKQMRGEYKVKNE